MIGLLLIPLLSLAALWGFAADITLGSVIRDQHYNTVITAEQPTVGPLQQTLAAERTLSVIWLKTDRRSPQVHAELLAARRGTDTYVAAIHRALPPVRGLLFSPASLDSLLSDLAGLPGIRSAVDAGTDTPVTAFSAYTAIGAGVTNFFLGSSPPGDPGLSVVTQAAIAGNSAENYIDGAIALTDGALAARGFMTQSERALFSEVVGQQDLEVGVMSALAPPALKAVFGSVFGQSAYQRLVAEEMLVAASPPGSPIPVDPATFQATVTSIQAAERSTQLPLGSLLAAQSARLSDSLLAQLFLAGGLGLAAVLISAFAAVRFGRRLRAELTRLYQSARRMADERLPRLVEQLSRGDDVDVHADSLPLPASRITEIASVARAFASVQRTAVEAAVGQADLRNSINHVFTSLSLRSQSLVHKQLSLLDGMERATSDPVVLADLFRLDHLTTRMRRHSEGLLILAGTTPGRAWRDPVPVADVLNAAVAEVEDYVRVDVLADSPHSVAGTAVNDVIHLLAELIENATTFSPPHTRVEIRGDAVGNGFAIEIEDRGLGIPREELAQINDRLASPPEFDLANTDQLGLFVTSKLAVRHGVMVALRPSPFGGISAIVVLPHSVMVTGHEAHVGYGIGGQPELASAAATGPARPSGLAGRQGLASAHQPNRNALPPQAPLEASLPWEPNASPPWERSLPPQGMPPPSSPGAAGSTGRPGLPRRVRQASLAPQLRERISSGQPARPAEPEPPLRSPEEASGLMAALQDGWQRARHHGLDYPDFR